MKTLLCLTLAVSALASPALSFAQSTNTPLTRAQVYADLVRVEQAGYRPEVADDANYPADIQTAEAKVAAEDQAANEASASSASSADNTGTGPGMSGSSASGAHVPMNGKSSNNACVGPVSFCNVYFGS
jgi:hypothetical protein